MHKHTNACKLILSRQEKKCKQHKFNQTGCNNINGLAKSPAFDIISEKTAGLQHAELFLALRHADKYHLGGKKNP